MTAQDQRIYIPKTDICVAGLVRNGKVIMPAFRLGDIEFRTNHRGDASSSAEYYRLIRVPTIAQLVRAYLDKINGSHMRWHKEGGQWETDSDDWASPDYRRSIVRGEGKGEYTATFIQPRKKKRCEVVPKGYRPVRLINRPERVSFDRKRRIWVAEYDDSDYFDILEPPDGYISRICHETGYPEKTFESKLQNMGHFFGEDAYFSSTILADDSVAGNRNLRAVVRYAGFNFIPTFQIRASIGVGYRDKAFGARSCAERE